MSINNNSSKTIEETSGKKRVQLTPEDKPLDITRVLVMNKSPRL